MKKIIFLSFFILLFAYCSKNDIYNDNDQNYSIIGGPVTGDWVISSLSSEPPTLNPITATDAYAAIINSYIAETLIERDLKTLVLKPLLAYKWEISPNKLQYTFYLNHGIKWHDGVELTTDDIIFSYNKIKDPKVDSAPLRIYYKDVVKIEALDKYTVRFTYNRPYFLALEVCGSMPIVPKHILNTGDFNKHAFNRQPIGTGPYIFEKWETGKNIVLDAMNNIGTRPKSQTLIKLFLR